MWINRAGSSLAIVDVTRGGPADAAGLNAGEAILAVDGVPVTGESLIQLRGRFRADPAGTKIRLSVSAGGKTRDVELVLKDLV